MPKRDKLDKSQEEGQGPEELDITQILSEVNDYEELGPDQSAMDAYGMTDPALGDVDRILRRSGKNWASQRKRLGKPGRWKTPLPAENSGTRSIGMPLTKALSGPFRGKGRDPGGGGAQTHPPPQPAEEIRPASHEEKRGPDFWEFPIFSAP